MSTGKAQQVRRATEMHGLYAALGFHTAITKHSRGVNCILTQTVQSAALGASQHSTHNSALQGRQTWQRWFQKDVKLFL